jgi:hypothetical protein
VGGSGALVVVLVHTPYYSTTAGARLGTSDELGARPATTNLQAGLLLLLVRRLRLSTLTLTLTLTPTLTPTLTLTLTLTLILTLTLTLTLKQAYCCTQFAVSAARIRLRSHLFWRSLLADLLDPEVRK